MNHFEPSIARAQSCRQAMDAALWASVEDLLEELGEDRAASDGAGGGDSETGMLDYAAYFDLALTTSEAVVVPPDAKEEARSWLARRLGQVTPDAVVTRRPPRITNLTTEAYSADEIARMIRWWDIEPANRMAMSPALPAEFDRCRDRIAQAMDMLALASPEMHGEVETIVRDIVLARPDGSNLINYSGASSFALWGAITINSETNVEWLQIFRQIVHETGHNLLFGIARDQPLVTAGPDERRGSPLRADPRPMDGIFHAAYVSARESCAFEALLQANEKEACLPPEDVEVLVDLLNISVFSFWDCVDVLRDEENAMTELGEAVLADCEEWMTANFAVEPA